MDDKNKSAGVKLSDMGIIEAKQMAAYILEREFRGPGDTIDGAAYRAERRWGAPANLIKRLRHRDVKDMLLSNYLVLKQAYDAATAHARQAYEHERMLADAANPSLVRVADFISGTKGQEEDAA